MGYLGGMGPKSKYEIHFCFRHTLFTQCDSKSYSISVMILSLSQVLQCGIFYLRPHVISNFIEFHWDFQVRDPSALVMRIYILSLKNLTLDLILHHTLKLQKSVWPFSVSCPRRLRVSLLCSTARWVRCGDVSQALAYPRQ